MQYLHHLILSLILFSSHLHADEKQQCEEALFTTRNPLELQKTIKRSLHYTLSSRMSQINSTSILQKYSAQKNNGNQSLNTVSH